MIDKENKLNTDPYKGVRDFFPADMAVLQKIFRIWRTVCEKYGYEEYGASVLEPAELYRAKSGEEIVNEQTYTFKDRGDREVTLRPEMTPTITRMVSSKRRDLIFPLRWYSIPNLFRYEQPQRGRVREHWQLNVDIFGIESINAEIEAINMAYDIMHGYGLKDSDFEIRLNSRKLMNYLTKNIFNLDDLNSLKISKLIDKKDKLSPDDFKAKSIEVFSSLRRNKSEINELIEKFLTMLNTRNFDEFISTLPQTNDEISGLIEIKNVIAGLERLGITNVRFDQTLMRGFDYYTGIVFEVYDLNPINKRSVFGGGRYDDLLSLFGNEKIPAVGFGAGDVIARDLMDTYGTLSVNGAIAHLAICVVGEIGVPYSLDLAQSLRDKGIKVTIDFSGKKLGDQISNADKRGIPKIVCIGDEEIKTGRLKLKTLATQQEIVTDEQGLIELLSTHP